MKKQSFLGLIVLALGAVILFTNQTDIVGGVIIAIQAFALYGQFYGK